MDRRIIHYNQRKKDGICVRCDKPAEATSIFCLDHKYSARLQSDITNRIKWLKNKIADYQLRIGYLKDKVADYRKELDHWTSSQK